MTNGNTDPAQQWSDLLSSLTGQRREAVVAALRSSAEQGWPADREAVRLLVAYANGEIDAQDYAVGIVVSLGGHENAVQPQSPPPFERPWAQQLAEQSWAAPQQAAPQPAAPAAPAPAPPVASLTPENRLTREEAVAAYVSGRIPVEEFLRITRGVSA
ncbi:hypothetical protein [Aeromicrobium ginsengisoli]|uniref:Antitoxin VbhA domain-containing protein n=1 Tax=Aeromicrobium ginsengisoli TaxID=363867 RepID=A0A5M4FAF2_9ACTN|nr:hypothetical protein [Aeromicrobium ginsengisoli]KAA1395321.1 hypothetical protein ESP70_014235 [Aeromicrobium ginsengisoli]